MLARVLYKWLPGSVDQHDPPDISQIVKQVLRSCLREAAPSTRLLAMRSGSASLHLEFSLCILRASVISPSGYSFARQLTSPQWSPFSCSTRELLVAATPNCPAVDLSLILSRTPFACSFEFDLLVQFGCAVVDLYEMDCRLTAPLTYKVGYEITSS